LLDPPHDPLKVLEVIAFELLLNVKLDQVRMLAGVLPVRRVLVLMMEAPGVLSRQG
jgi:hypothetical protein